MVEITRARGVLYRRRRGSHPGRMSEVEELGHVHLSGVARCQAGQFKACLDQFKNCRIVSHGMGDEILPGERRDHNQRHTITGMAVVTGGAGGGGAEVSWLQVSGQNGVGRNSGLWRHVVKESAEFVMRKNQ